MKMVNNGYVSRVPQDLEGTIEEIQEGGSGSDEYDLVFRTTEINLNDITAESTELESGTFADAYAKVLSGKKLSIRFYGYGTGDNDLVYTCDYDISSVYADRGYGNYISFSLTGGYSDSGAVFNDAYAADTSGGSTIERIFGVMYHSPIKVYFSESGITMERIGQ